ncbi:MAG: FtsW/RodA/SpoVE family cell cycle protein [Anaerolineae bacterium]
MHSPGRTSRAGFDWPLLLAVLAISLLGVAMIGSAIRNTPDLVGYDTRQLQFLVLGLVAAVVLAAVDYRLIVSSGLVWYCLGLALLLVVAIVGATIHGGQRWIPIGSFTLQPSELMKIALVIALAQYLGARREEPWRFRYLVVSAIILAIPVGLVYLQPDLGTALVLVAIWGVVVFTSGVSMKQVLVLLLVAGAAAPVIYANLHGYMRDRVTAYINPGEDPDIAYMVDQALISIGSGSIWGKGYGAGTQSQLHFLRVRHSDFLFSVIGEELGFVGTMVVIGLLGFIIYRLIRIGLRSSDGAGTVIACGVATLIAFQSVVNIGMNAGLLPVTGLPLPFISHGGSALLAQLAGIGLAQSVALRSDPLRI